MNSLDQKLRHVIADHVRGASATEIIAIASTLCSEQISSSCDGASITEAAPRFTVSGDVVTDALTGLMWTRAVVSGGKRNWCDAVKAASDVKLGGYSDWRAPTIAERLAISDYTRSEPALDPVFLSDKSGWEWASTPYAPSPGDCAWFVLFSDGNSYWGGQGNGGFVRAVRPGQLLGTLA